MPLVKKPSGSAASVSHRRRGKLEMALIVQQPHSGIRQPDHVEQLAIDVVQIADPQIQLVAANAVDNLFRGQRTAD
jgi:hypothetical protein